MNDEPVLRDQARTAMHSGRLPSCPPERMWGGPGSGACCAVCGQALKQDEVEIELQFPPDHDGRALCNRHLHIGCFKAWEWVASRHGGVNADPALDPSSRWPETV
jgi:hypothetical protein